MAGSLTVTDGTHSVTTVDTLTLNAAGTVSGGSSHATITGSDPVKVYLPGGLGTDSGGESSTITSYQTASETGSTVNITWFENNSGVSPSTADLYLTLARASSLGGTLDVDTILDAALQYSSTNGVAIYVPAGTYTLIGTNASHTTSIRQTLSTNAALIGAPGFQTVFALAYSRSGSEGAFVVSGDNVVVQDIMVTGYNATYLNFWTNQPVSLTGTMASSLFDWQTVSIGDLGGTTTLALDGGWQVSTNPALRPLKSATEILFDYLPDGYTVSSLGSLLTGTSVLWNYCVERGVTVAGVSEVGSGTYALALNGTGPESRTLTRGGFTPTAGIADPVSQTTSNPDYLAQQAFPAAFVQFANTDDLKFYTGDYFHIYGAFASFRNVACVGVTSGAAFYGQCLSPRFTNTHCLATFGDGGSAGFRLVALGAVFEGCISNSGDDGAQQSQQPTYDPNYLNSMNNPAYLATLGDPAPAWDFTGSTFAERWIGCDITTIGTGRACAIILSANPIGDPLTWTSNSTTFSPSSVQFSASDAPSGLTLSMLGLSAPPWAAGFVYETEPPTYVVNDSNLYSLTMGGTSALTGAGPTGTGSVVVDNQCTWSCLSAGLGETIYMYDTGLAVTEPGAYVTGYTESDGTVTVTASAPIFTNGTATTTTEPFTGPQAGADFVFLLSTTGTIVKPATPPMIMSNSVDFQFYGCILRSVSPEVVAVANDDSFGTARAAFHGCTFDGSWCIDVRDTAGAMMQIDGTAIVGGGGCRVTVDECRFYAPAVACISSTGANSYIGIFRSELYPPGVGAGMLPNVMFAGAAELDFVENTVWATQDVEDPSYTAGVVTLGGTATSYVGLVLPGTVSNARIVGNRFLGLYANEDYTTPGLDIDYADAVIVSNNVFAAGANATATTVTGIAITSNATNVISVGNNFSTCPVAYSGVVTQLSINGNEIYDSSGEGYVTPPVPSYLGVSSLTETWTPTLSCATNPGSLSITYDTLTAATVVRTLLSDGTTKNDIRFRISGTCSLTGTPTASGDMRIYGLPYTSTSAGGQGVSVCSPISAFDWAYPSGMLVWGVEPSNTFLLLNNLQSGSVHAVQSIESIFSSVGVTFTFCGVGSYLAID